MPSDTTPGAVVVSILDVESVISYAWIAAATVYLYDRCLTFEREVRLVWQRRGALSVTAGCYMLLHVSAAMFLGLTIVAIILTSCKSYAVHIVQSCSLPVFRFAYGGLTAVRAYAISGRSLSLAVAVFLLGLVSPVVDIYEYSRFYIAAVLPQHLGCIMNVRLGQHEERILNTTADISDIVSEAILVAVTWRHTYRMGRLPDGSYMKTPLATSLVRNGAMYFIAILVMTLANAAMTIPDSNAYDGVLTAPTTALQAILISRFYLNLRSAASPDGDESTIGSSQVLSSARFNYSAGETLRDSSFMDTCTNVVYTDDHTEGAEA